MSGDELKSLRQRVGLTVDDLARLAGVSLTTINHWESGASKTPRAVGLRILLSRLEQRRREMLTATEGRKQWEDWLDQQLAVEEPDEGQSRVQ